ncbi:MAG: GHKL domain-containing protein, partial [Oscillospiraceae bacterium]|nr:GHKL domain-containing protein [Oscillospiraceae bacterium]
RALLLFGCLPALYYVYDYTVALRSNLLYSDLLTPDLTYSGSQMVAEILPTVVGLLYMVYTTAYRQQLQRRTRAELHNSLTAGHLKQAEAEMASLRQAEAQAATYQHDMRHHLAAISAFLTAGKPQQAEEYIKQVQADIEAITPKRFCENELVNLLCSSFSTKAERMGVRLTLEATLPSSLPISDTELCALLSNGLENALNAVGELKENRRWVEFYCGVRLDKLLIEIKNPYAGEIPFRDGLPESTRPSHGYGCRSIHTIARTHRGLCEFKAENGIFTLRVALPM